ncbi:helix-turn-helix transcriptional regulator [Paenibacillus elgii]|uniref:helix-turn-helix transcriptional regulator n=1 Tax=Paenibacillus elgii TaxID=189691 RepID=UPI00203AC1AA|nr:LuxR C-terminal-related transcriptional regulator [Paenibacillus elgii]
MIIFTDWLQRTDYPVASIATMEHQVLKKWDEQIKSAGLHRDTVRISRLSPERIREKLVSRSALIRVLLSEIEAMQELLHITHFFVIADPSGVILELGGKDDILQNLRLANIGPGTLCTIKHSGYSAIAMAMETGMTAIVRGNEHTLQFFRDGNCICAPIRVGGVVQAYVNLMFAVAIDPTFAIPLLRYIATQAEKRLQAESGGGGREDVYDRFAAYQLTERQKEVAYKWLQGQTCVQIAQSLYLSVHTVRTVLKTIYEKTAVNSKVAFIRKFTG